MELEFRLKQELSQRLLLTPQLKQAIAILQLPALELAAMVEKELLENPVLELDEEKTEVNGIDTISKEHSEYIEIAEMYDKVNDWQLNQHEDKQTFESFTSQSLKLQDHLEFQLHLAARNKEVQKIGEFLIGSIDDNGYLTLETTEAAKDLKVNHDDVLAVLALIQTFEPIGVGARNLKECLMLQLDYRYGDYKLAREIIENYLDYLADGHLKQLAQKLNITVQEAQEAADIIKTLAPKPGAAIGEVDSTLFIQADVTVKKDIKGYIILINDSNIPQIMISPYYRNIIKNGDQDTKKYLENRFNSAIWLLKSIEQRKRTIYNVTEALLKLQREFFDYGIKYLNPLTMKQVAKEIGVHESTVSRATANKYIDTPHGVFSMRIFFNASVNNDAGELVAASKVKQDLKALIAQENVKKPLSDQAIADIFTNKGINISRRTITKYREELGIQASSKRKRF